MQDIVSYNLHQSIGEQHNLVAVLMSQKGLSIQGAVNFAASLIRKTFDAFIATEKSLIAMFFPPSSSSLPKKRWSWRSSSPSSAHAPRPRWSDEAIENTELYIQGLKDCVVGSINWVYETEMYFGVETGKGKGEEVRKFGWVFLLPCEVRELEGI